MSAIRLGICALIAFAVLAHGGVEPWSEGVLEVGAALLLLVLAGRSAIEEDFRLVWNPLFVPLLAIWLIGAVQWGAGISLVPFLTRIELLKYSALVALFFLCVQSYRTRSHWRGFVWFLLILGFGVSLFAILQHFTWNGKLYWVREMRYGGMPFGPYVNRNHFAGLMELLIPPGVAILLLEAERRDQLPLITLFTLLPIGALFLSASRGGIMSFVAEMGFLAVLVFLRRREKKALVAAALIITTTSPAAASGVRTGAMSVAAGRMSPRAAATSTRPIAFTWLSLKSSTQAICGASLARGWVSFMAPAMRNPTASTI